MIITVGEIENKKEYFSRRLKKGQYFKVVRGARHDEHCGHKITKGDIVQFLKFEEGTNYLRFETKFKNYTFLEERILLALSTPLVSKLKEFLNSHPLDKETEDV